MANFNIANYNMNNTFFNKVNSNNMNEDKFLEMESNFTAACEDLAYALMIGTYKKPVYDMSDFIDAYESKVKSGQYTLRKALEKYVLDVTYGKGVMNSKFNLKHNGSASNKLAKLLAVRNYINNPSRWPNGNFSWKNINDPDYYDLNAASNRTNINWYTNSLNNRIANYRRKAKL